VFVSVTGFTANVTTSSTDALSGSCSGSGTEGNGVHGLLAWDQLGLARSVFIELKDVRYDVGVGLVGQTARIVLGHRPDHLAKEIPYRFAPPL